MKSMAQRNFGRSLAVAAVICSWLALSNHCAVAALAAWGTGQPALDHRQGADATECPFHSKPAKQKDQPSQMQCSRILRAIVLAKAKGWARDDAKFSDADLRFQEFALIAPSRHTPTPLLLDTGPPGAHSFAELILQRSLLAHAPPPRA